MPPFFLQRAHISTSMTADDDEALNLRFFVRLRFNVTRLLQLHRINQSHFADDDDAKSTTLVERIQPPPLSARRKREGETVSLFSSTRPKTKTFCLLRSQSLFSIIIIVRRREVEKKSNGVVWLERIRLIGLNVFNAEGIVVVVDIEKETR